MKKMSFVLSALLLLGVSAKANAWFFIFPIPNLAKPPALEKIIDALEKSSEVRALAYASENKTFGSKQWVWAYHTNGKNQQDADQLALKKCEETLRNMKSQVVGGQPLYDFGGQTCKLHEFTNVSPAPATAQTETPVIQNKSSVEEKLVELKGLFDKGLITQEEYDEKRKELLKEIR